MCYTEYLFLLFLNILSLLAIREQNLVTTDGKEIGTSLHVSARNSSEHLKTLNLCKPSLEVENKIWFKYVCNSLFKDG